MNFAIADGAVFDNSNRFLHANDSVNEGEEWGMEVDLRSQEKEKRTIHWFVGGRQQKVFITGVPDRVQFAVCYSCLIYYLFILYITLLVFSC